MPISREALLSHNQFRINQGLEWVLDRTSASHADPVGQVGVAEQAVGMPSYEEHHGQSKLLAEDGLREASHRVVHGYRRHRTTILATSQTRYGNLVAWSV